LVIYIFIILIDCIQISDFGLSKWRNYSRTYSTVSGVQGTLTHIPPEYWVNPNLRINDKFDVYSFAILLYEMYAERKPFEDYQLKGNLRILYCIVYIKVLNGQLS